MAGFQNAQRINTLRDLFYLLKEVFIYVRLLCYMSSSFILPVSQEGDIYTD